MITSFKSCLLTGIIFAAFPAHATSKISSPDITQGRVEFEYRGGYDSDNHTGRDGKEQHKFVANYGILDFWRTEVKGVALKADGGYDWKAAEWSQRFQLLKGAAGGPKLSVQANYVFALDEGEPDGLELTALASHQTGRFLHTLNATLAREVGSHAGDGTNLDLGWRTRYLWREAINPGLELYTDFGQYGGPDTSGAKEYLLGPTLAGKLGEGWSYDIGVLAGISDAAPEARFKWILTYGFEPARLIGAQSDSR